MPKQLSKSELNNKIDQAKRALENNEMINLNIMLCMLNVNDIIKLAKLIGLGLTNSILSQDQMHDVRTELKNTKHLLKNTTALDELRDLKKTQEKEAAKNKRKNFLLNISNINS